MSGHNVFISWSGDRSKAVAKKLHEWLPMIVQAAKPWMSDSDVDKGSVGLDEIARALEGTKLGIVCLTPENLTSEWIHYEAGALTKSVNSTTSRLWTYLIGGLENSQIKAPLGRFQATKAEKEETRRLVHSINRVLSEAPLPDTSINRLFDALWPDLENALQSLSGSTTTALPVPDVPAMIAEILAWTRAQARRDETLSLAGDPAQRSPTALETIWRKGIFPELDPGTIVGIISGKSKDPAVSEEIHRRITSYGKLRPLGGSKDALEKDELAE
jgi:hypothetical protein